MSVAIIDYGSGNLHSAAKAFERARRSMETPDKIVVTRDPDVVFRADRIVLPGVGAFADCRAGLDALDGMVDALTEAVRHKARPFFGICVGMQLMATHGKEYVTTDGFNWIAGDVEKTCLERIRAVVDHYVVVDAWVDGVFLVGVSAGSVDRTAVQDQRAAVGKGARVDCRKPIGRRIPASLVAIDLVQSRLA